MSASASPRATGGCGSWSAAARYAAIAPWWTARLLASRLRRRLPPRQADRDTVVSFEEAVAGVPHVVQAQRLFGDPDYLLRVVTTDLAAYQQLYDEKLIALPGVQRMASTLVMKRVVHDRPLPA